MQQVTLLASGKLAAQRSVVTTGVLPYLGDALQLADDVTLRSYFRLLLTYPLLAELNRSLPDLLDQYRKLPETDCHLAGVDHLRLDKTVEMIGFPGPRRLEIYTSLKPVGVAEVAVKDVGLDGLLDVALKLGKLTHVVFGDSVDALTFDTVFTLFEFIEAIAWELGFQGAAQQCQTRR